MSFSGIGKSFDPMWFDRSGNGSNAVPGLIVSMSFQSAIPRRVALLHRPLPLRQPVTILRYSRLAGRVFSIERLAVS